jgi:hypothetical protein
MYVQIVWDDEPGGNTEHVGEHGVTKDEAEEILCDDEIDVVASRRHGDPCKFGWTSTGKYIIVVFQEVPVDPKIIVPVTAYETPPPARR